MQAIKDIDIHNVDCFEYMRGIESNSIPLIVTDPPYGINFSGQTSDMKTEKILGDYVFTIERENGKCVDVPITEFDYVPSECFSVDVCIYGENISNYFSDLLPFSARHNRLLNKNELVFNCKIADENDNHIATLHSAYISSYNHIPNTDMETISLRADYFEVGHVVSASTIFAEMSAELNKKADENARKYADMDDGW